MSDESEIISKTDETHSKKESNYSENYSENESTNRQETSLKARELTNFDVYYIVKRLEKLIEKKARLERVYDLGDVHLIMRIKTESGRVDLVFYPPKYLFLKRSENIEIEPTPFATSIKNMFSNRLIRSVKQINNDRIVEIIFDSGSIILECMKKGNVILLENRKIVNLKEKITEKERVLQIGNEYKAPKNERKEITKENILSLLRENKDSEEKIVVLISRNLIFPAFYFNKIMQSIDFDPKTKCQDLDEKEIEKIAERMATFYSNLIEGKVALRIEEDYFLSDKMDDRNNSCIRNREKNKNDENDDKNDNNENDNKIDPLFDLLSMLYINEISSKKSEAKEKKMNQLLNRLKHQEERIKALEEEIKKERAKGEWIIKNSEKITEIIRRYKEIRSKGSRKELEEFLKENNIEMVKNHLKIIVKD